MNIQSNSSLILSFPGTTCFQLYDTEVCDLSGQERGVKWADIYWNSTLHDTPKGIEDQIVPETPASKIILTRQYHGASPSQILSLAEFKHTAEYLLAGPAVFSSSFGDITFPVSVQVKGEMIVAYILLQGFIPSYYTFPWQIDREPMGRSGHRIEKLL